MHGIHGIRSVIVTLEFTITGCFHLAIYSDCRVRILVHCCSRSCPLLLLVQHFLFVMSPYVVQSLWSCGPRAVTIPCVAICLREMVTRRYLHSPALGITTGCLQSILGHKVNTRALWVTYGLLSRQFHLLKKYLTTGSRAVGQNTRSSRFVTRRLCKA